MSKMTIATDDRGNLLGAVQHADDKHPEGLQAAVNFGPGARLKTIDVKPEIDMGKASDAAKFHDALARHARSSK